MAKVQLILLHFAGGNCYSYDFLKDYVKNTNMEMHALELPGRGKRHHESLVLTKEAAIEDYVHQIKQLRNKQPYFIFGHSMGATLGLSVAKQMELVHDKPEALIVSGNPGPGIEKPEKEGKRHLMNDIDFKNALRKLGGVPEEVLEHEELYEFFSPIMRADFQVLENDDFSEKGIQVHIPIVALMGDKEDMNEQIDNWKNFTSASFNSMILEGNHFFIKKHPKKIIEVINKISGPQQRPMQSMFI